MNINLDKVPLTINESFQMFIEALTEEEKKAFKEVNEQDLALFHLSFGELIRNAWSMSEKNTPLVNDFEKIGITHADDMTKIIFTSTYRQLHKKPIKLQDQVKKIQDYWQKEIGKKIP